MKEEIKQRILDLEINIANSNYYWNLYEEIDYNGSLHEIIDGMIDIYYYDLRRWAVDNWEYIELANEEGINGETTDYHKQIQGGQYMYYQEQANEIIEEIFNEYKENEK